MINLIKRFIVFFFFFSFRKNILLHSDKKIIRSILFLRFLMRATLVAPWPKRIGEIKAFNLFAFCRNFQAEREDFQVSSFRAAI